MYMYKWPTLTPCCVRQEESRENLVKTYNKVYMYLYMYTYIHTQVHIYINTRRQPPPPCCIRQG